MDTNMKKEDLVPGRSQLRKGQRIVYEGKEAVVICVKPMLTLKFKDRIICGSLNGRIEFINKSNNMTSRQPKIPGNS